MIMCAGIPSYPFITTWLVHYRKDKDCFEFFLLSSEKARPNHSAEHCGEVAEWSTSFHLIRSLTSKERITSMLFTHVVQRKLVLSTVHKTAEEVAELEAKVKTKEELRAQRRAEQEANVRKKQK
jgi:hypothetical protein